MRLIAIRVFQGAILQSSCILYSSLALLRGLVYAVEAIIRLDDSLLALLRLLVYAVEAIIRLDNKLIRSIKALSVC